MYVCTSVDGGPYLLFQGFRTLREGYSLHKKYSKLSFIPRLQILLRLHEAVVTTHPSPHRRDLYHYLHPRPYLPHHLEHLGPRIFIIVCNSILFTTNPESFIGSCIGYFRNYPIAYTGFLVQHPHL